MNGLLPYNNAGLVDPFANAMQGGLGQMYAIQQAQAQARDQDQAYLSNLNKYQNELEDNPLKAAERQNKLSAQGILADQFSSGLAAVAANSKLEGDIAENRAKVDKAYMGPQMERAASETTRFIDDMKAIEEAGGGELEKKAYWAKNVAPVFQKMGAPDLNFNMARLERLNKHFIEQGAQSKEMAKLLTEQSFRAAMAENEQKSRERIASMTTAAADKSGTVDRVLGRYLEENPEAIPGYIGQKFSGGYASTVRSVSNDVGVKLATFEVQNSELELQSAMESGDTKKIETAAQKVNRAKDKLSQAVKQAQEMGQPKAGEPKKEPTEVERRVSPSTGDTWVKMSDGTFKNLGKISK